MTIQLRPYQQNLVNDIYNQWQHVQSVCGVMPTGAGKAYTLSYIVREFMNRGQKCVVQVHRRELVGQLSCSLATLGVVHYIIGSKATKEFVKKLHLEQFGRIFLDDMARVCLASVQTLVGKKGVSKEDRIKEARLIHGDKYDYSLWNDSLTRHKKVSIVCPDHGVFEMVLANHLHQKQGCPSCATYGFDPSSKAFLYVLRSEEGYLKFGISNKYKKRIKELRNKTPFSFDLLAVFEHEDGSEVSKLEKQLHKLFPSANQKGFDGATEWFIVRDLDILYFPELLGFKRVI